MLITETGPAAMFDASDAELRQMLRLEADETDEDTLIASMIAAAVSRAENFTRRRFLTQTVRLFADTFRDYPDGMIALPVTPIKSVDQVEYVDTDGVTQTLPDTDYVISRSGVGEVLRPAYGATWPDVRCEPDAVRIDLIVGYGDAASDVPADILQAIRYDVAHMFLHRDMAGQQSPDLPGPTRTSLSPYRVFY